MMFATQPMRSLFDGPGYYQYAMPYEMIGLPWLRTSNDCVDSMRLTTRPEAWNTRPHEAVAKKHTCRPRDTRTSQTKTTRHSIGHHSKETASQQPPYSSGVSFPPCLYAKQRRENQAAHGIASQPGVKSASPASHPCNSADISDVVKTAPTPVSRPALQQQQQRPSQHCSDAAVAEGNVTISSRCMPPDQAATVVQAAWRMSRLQKQRPVLKQLASAAAHLAVVQQHLAALQSSAIHMTQKQFLELSEPVMKVLFLLDGTSSSVSEVRAVRKRLTLAANQLLDEIQALYQAPHETSAASDTAETEVYHDCEDEDMAAGGDTIGPEQGTAHMQSVRDDVHKSSEQAPAPPAAAAAAGGVPAAGSTPRRHKQSRRHARSQVRQQLQRAGLCPSQWWLKHFADY